MKIVNLNIKKIFKYFLYLLTLLIIFTFYELINIDSTYVNKSAFSIDVNNVRNPQIKKIVRKIDNLFGQVYFSLNKSKQKEFYENNLNYYNSLPDEIIVKPKLTNLTLSNNKSINNEQNWMRSHGNHSSNKFSNLKKINKKNVNLLDVAWTHTFDKKKDIAGNPIFYQGTIFLSSTDKSLVALDALSGKKKWEFKTEGTAARRGLLINDEKNPKVYFCDQQNLIALHADKGKPVKEFGNNGIIKLKKNCQITPVIMDDKIIIGTFEPSIEVYDLKSGKILWRFYLKEKNEDYFRYGGKRYDYSGGNPWGGISADLERKILFVTTGNAGRFYEGTTRPGDNKYSNSIVAIDIEKKKLLWEFQEIAHDIWNYDIASPPILTSIKVNNKKIDVVVAPSKFGNTIVLDRLTGNNIFEYKKKKVPLSNVPGEKTSYYQKIFSLPKPLSRQYFEESHITNISKKSFEFVKERIKDTTYGLFVPNSIDKKNIIYKGGAQWMGASIDNQNSIMYVTSNDVPFLIWLEKIKTNDYYDYSIKSDFLVDHLGYPGSKPPWGRLTSINLNNGKKIWEIPFGEYENLTKQGIPITGTYNFGGVTGTAGGLLFATGAQDNKVKAFDSSNGNELWNYQLPFSGSTPPTIFEHLGEQYVIVVSTGSYSLKQAFPKFSKFGNKIFAFKLPK
tara:strand:- start:455 stop:2476 length:2022 start_codon:yes stop_codon:yes gene_type:complete